MSQKRSNTFDPYMDISLEAVHVHAGNLSNGRAAQVQNANTLEKALEGFTRSGSPSFKETWGFPKIRGTILGVPILGIS